MYTKFENNPSRGFWVIALTPLRAAGGGWRAAGGGRRATGGGRLRRKTITSPDPSDTGDIITTNTYSDIHGWVQEKCNSIADALELHFCCTNLSIWGPWGAHTSRMDHPFTYCRCIIAPTFVNHIIQMDYLAACKPFISQWRVTTPGNRWYEIQLGR